MWDSYVWCYNGEQILFSICPDSTPRMAAVINDGLWVIMLCSMQLGATNSARWGGMAGGETVRELCTLLSSCLRGALLKQLQKAKATRQKKK